MEGEWLEGAVEVGVEQSVLHSGWTVVRELPAVELLAQPYLSQHQLVLLVKKE